MIQWPLYNDDIVKPDSTIGRYTILSVFRTRIYRPADDWQKARWMLRPVALCQCACGTVKVVTVSNLRAKGTKSCGCLRLEEASQRLQIWETQDKRLHAKWSDMLRRCYTSRASAHRNYYGIIDVCDEWLNFDTFAKWCIDRGWTPDCDLQIDRENGKGNYCPENCQLLTKADHDEKTALERRKN